jgi:hypothetical protein
MDFKNFYLREAHLPLGFSTDDIESIDDFLADNEVIDEDINDAETSGVDMAALKQRRMNPPKKDTEHDISSRPEKLLHKSNIVDENGNVIDDDALRNKIIERPKTLIGQNSKLGKSGTNQMFYDLTLPSYQGLYVDEKTGEFKVVKTCPAAGECRKFCYAAKGGYIMFPASSLGASRTVNFLMNDEEGFKSQLLSELKAAIISNAKKGKKVVLRWHDSGDFLSEKYLLLAYSVAKATPEILHYAYTKQVPLVRKLEEHKPKNFIFNFSLGGLHDETIDKSKEKHAAVVPANLFKDLPHTKGEDGYAVIFAPKELAELKKRVADHFKIPLESIISYDEMIKTPPSEDKKWNVLVWKGHGDDAATREDVLGTYLLFH